MLPLRYVPVKRMANFEHCVKSCDLAVLPVGGLNGVGTKQQGRCRVLLSFSCCRSSRDLICYCCEHASRFLKIFSPLDASLVEH